MPLTLFRLGHRLRFFRRQHETNSTLGTLQDAVKGAFTLGTNHEHGASLVQIRTSANFPSHRIYKPFSALCRHADGSCRLIFPLELLIQLENTTMQEGHELAAQA